MSTPQDDAPRTPDTDQPDGGDGTTGRTPHADAPAEGADPDTVEDAEAGTDPANRITGI